MSEFPNATYSTLIPTIGTADTFIELSEDGIFFSVSYGTINNSIVIFYVSNLTIAATITTNYGSVSHVWSSDSK
jgi:hypothetical protein